MRFVVLKERQILDMFENEEEVLRYSFDGTNGELALNIYMPLEQFMLLPSKKRMIDHGRLIAEVVIGGEKKWLHVYPENELPGTVSVTACADSSGHVTSPFVAVMHRLRYIQRWNMMRNFEKEYVAEHSFMTAIIAHLLASIGREAFQKSVPDAEVVAFAAVTHEAAEALCSDVPSPVKNQMLEQFKKLESMAAERFIGMIPEPLRPVYGGYIHQKNSQVKKYVEAADLIDAYLKAAGECEAGNRDYVVAKRELEIKLYELGMEEVVYFLEVFAPAFFKTLDEINF